MSTIAILASHRSYVASLGAMIDAHARLGELFESNPALGDYAEMHTRLVLASVSHDHVELAGGRQLACDTAFAALGEVRMAYLPSFQILDPEQLDAILADAAPFHQWLARLGEAGIHIGASGASVFHLAAAGLLDGQECAVPDALSPAFRQRFAKVRVVEANPLCVSGRCITCVHDFGCPALVIRLFTEAFSPAIAQSIALRAPPEAHAPQLGPFVDPLVARAQLWIRDRFTRDFRIGDLAAELGTSHQSLIRRFRAADGDTPRNYVQRIRAETAASMLLETNRSIAEIAQLVGYKDIASFRQVFMTIQGMSPGAFRKRARGLSGGHGCPEAWPAKTSAG